jgi:hypothetical protein
MLHLIGTENEITAAINGFNHSYHIDYAQVRNVAICYLASAPSALTAMALAEAIYDVMGNWGAGVRKAPLRRSPALIAERLLNSSLHHRLKKLADPSSLGLSVNSHGLPTLLLHSRLQSVHAFHREFLDTLAELANAFFVNNTNTTYPTKALLLLTGLAPALDRQVRKGLKRAGMKGMSGTQFLLPTSSSTAFGLRLCSLPFWVGHCWQGNKEVFLAAIKRSNHSALSSEPGRVFDILLFMQQDPRSPMTLAFNTLFPAR